MKDLAVHLEKILDPKQVIREPDALVPYGQDESRLGTYLPQAVALVKTEEEIVEILKLAALDRIPITPRGTGTGMTGGALPIMGGIVLCCERMNRILEIDEENLLARVEPGVITQILHQSVESVDLFYPPDPASLESCSLGGNVAENAGGPRAFKYGVTREYVLGLKLVLIGGQSLFLGRRSVKGVTGFDLTALTVGSEGCLGVISEIFLKLIPKPAATAAFLASFINSEAASTAVTKIIHRGLRPRALELLDQEVVYHLRKPGASKGRWTAPSQPGALLLVEIDGPQETLQSSLLDLANACEKAGATEIAIATDERKRQQFWEMRRAISPLLREQHQSKVSEDIALPRAHIPEMIRRLETLGASHGVRIACYGHAGDGNLHVNVLIDDDRPTVHIEPLIKQLFENTIALGGTLSGEHGIGLAKQQYLSLEQSEPLITLQKDLKQCFDPLGLMNPGKMFPGSIPKIS